MLLNKGGQPITKKILAMTLSMALFSVFSTGVLAADKIQNSEIKNGKISMPNAQKKMLYADKCETEIGSDCIL